MTVVNISQLCQFASALISVAKLVVWYIAIFEALSNSFEPKHILTLNFTDPQNSNPCITAIGYNGIQVWKTGMFSI